MTEQKSHLAELFAARGKDEFLEAWSAADPAERRRHDLARRD